MSASAPVPTYPSPRKASSNVAPSQNPTVFDMTRLAMIPVVRTTRPSMPPPTNPPPPAPDSPVQALTDTARHPSTTVVAMMARANQGSVRMAPPDTLSATSAADKGKAREIGERPIEGRQQTVRRTLFGAGGFIARVASRPSITSLRSASASIPRGSIPPLQAITTLHLSSRRPGGPDAATYIRPTHRTHVNDQWSQTRYAASSALHPSPKPSRHRSLKYASRIPTPSPLPGMAQPLPGLVEIPRFKKRSLNLGILRHGGPWQRLAWLGLWSFWLINGLSSLFFDVNVSYILVQCVIHPSYASSSRRSWTFAAAAYAVCWSLSTLVVWLGWEVGYESWRRWRLPRPAIEPIHLSLPATLHLALTSFSHFTFFLHIRLSPLGTTYATDIIPETCHAFVQLAPGLLPLLVRAGISTVIIVTFWKPELDLQTPFGSTDQTMDRDPHFFKKSAHGQLTTYAKGVLLAFVACVGLRLIVVIASIIGLWLSSSRPLGGLIGRRAFGTAQATVHYREPEMSTSPRDPSSTPSPQKSWLSEENDIDWAWRERTRARIQDAFELCIVRKMSRAGSTQGESSKQNRGYPRDMQGTGDAGVSTNASSLRSERATGSGLPDALPAPVIALDSTSSLSTHTPTEPPRPESILDPTGRHTSPSYPSLIRPTSSRLAGSTATLGASQRGASTSSHDLFYTPAASNTPATEKPRSIFEMPPIITLPAHSYEMSGENRQVTGFPAPEATVDSDSESSENTEVSRESIGDDSAGLISAIPSPHPSHNSLEQRKTTLEPRPAPANMRRKESATMGSGKVLNRSRSASINLLRGTVHNATAASNLVRRAKSGTMLSGGAEYRRVSGT